ncbi:MAG: hypothetical protein GYA62_08580 [Bacteroidales bacterium]|nr:hypothetical protein [Bacteroidales bacterium]
MSTKKINKTVTEVLIYTLFLVIMCLVSINISNFINYKQNKVLGLQTQNSDSDFWQSFLVTNPNYVPGWIEIGREDKALEIDPNYSVTP